MTKFITPVSMVCTPEQFERDLRKPLEAIGYRIIANADCGEQMTITCKSGLEPFDLSYFPECYIQCYVEIPVERRSDKIYYVTEYNPELFLALAAMTDEEDGIAGEWWMCRLTYKSVVVGGLIQFTENKLYQATSSGQRFIDDSGDRIGFGNTLISFKHFRKATKEELIAHFAKEETKSGEPEWEPKNGEEVEWLDTMVSDQWNKAIYVGKYDSLHVVAETQLGEVETILTSCVRPISIKRKITIQEIEEALNLTPGTYEIEDQNENAI